MLAYKGIVRSGSWREESQSKSYRFIYPWIVFYFLANCGITPIGNICAFISCENLWYYINLENFAVMWVVYLWYDGAPECDEHISKQWCKQDIVYLWSPLISVIILLSLIISLHNWILVVQVAKGMKNKLTPQPFLRIGSRIVLGLEPTSHGDNSTQSSTLSKSSTLFTYMWVQIKLNTNNCWIE